MDSFFKSIGKIIADKMMQQLAMPVPFITPPPVEVYPDLNETRFRFFSGLNFLIAIASISVQVSNKLFKRN